MSSKKRKYREKIAATGGGIPDIFDHPAFRASLPQEPTRASDDDTEELAVDEDDLVDAPAAEPRPA